MAPKNYPELETTLTRSRYGELFALPCAQRPGVPFRGPDASDEDRARLAAARELVALAAKSGKIPAAHGFDAQRLALRHEIYDLTPSASVVVLCLRQAQGTKYGVGTLAKRYVLLRRHGRGVSVEDVAPGAHVARWASQSGPTIGFVVAQCCRLAAKLAAYPPHI